MKKVLFIATLLIAILLTANLSVNYTSGQLSNLTIWSLNNLALADGESGGSDCTTLVTNMDSYSEPCPNSTCFSGYYSNDQSCVGSGNGGCYEGSYLKYDLCPESGGSFCESITIQEPTFTTCD